MVPRIFILRMHLRSEPQGAHDDRSEGCHSYSSQAHVIQLLNFLSGAVDKLEEL
jgi:hypothetical protein